MKSPEEMASELVAEIDAKAETHLASIRANTASAKDRLEQGMLNLKMEADPDFGVEPNSLTDEGWEFALNSEASEPVPESPPIDNSFETPETELPEEFAAFDTEPSLMTDADGIPLPE